MKYRNSLLIILAVFTLSYMPAKSIAQCNIKASANPLEICAGDSVLLSASGACGYLLNNDFNDQTIGAGLSSATANPVFNNPCGPGPNSWYLWVGATPSMERTLITNSYDVSSGNCKVEWYMRYGRVQPADDCEDPDLPDEGVHLQYSIDNGMTWVDFPDTNMNPVGIDSINPPFITTTPGTGGYWEPVSPQSAQLNNSLYYWHKYSCAVPSVAATSNTKFRWAQLATSSTGFDTWGIDEVQISCPASYHVQWSHGPTGFNPPPVYPTRDTMFIVTITDTVNNISASDTVIVKVKPKPEANFTVNINGLQAFFTDTSLYAKTYLWDFGNGKNDTVKNPVHTYTSAGIFLVKLIAGNECGTDTIVKNITTVGINSIGKQSSFRLYPNPSKGILFIESDYRNGGHYKISIFNVLGKLIQSRTISCDLPHQTATFDLSSFDKGIYYYIIQNNAEVKSGKIILE